MARAISGSSSTKTLNVHVDPIIINRIVVKIKGDTPYLPEPMDFDMLKRYDAKKGKKMTKKDDESEEDKLRNKFYYTADGKYGIPAVAFYKAMIRASSYVFEKSSGGMRIIREGVRIEGDILPLKYGKIEIRQDAGRNANKSPRIIYRNAFHDWETELTISFDSNILSYDQVINILGRAGFKIGVGGWRKECSGNFGCFSVEVPDKK